MKHFIAGILTICCAVSARASSPNDIASTTIYALDKHGHKQTADFVRFSRISETPPQYLIERFSNGKRSDIWHTMTRRGRWVPVPAHKKVGEAYSQAEIDALIAQTCRSNAECDGVDQMGAPVAGSISVLGLAGAVALARAPGIKPILALPLMCISGITGAHALALKESASTSKECNATVQKALAFKDGELLLKQTSIETFMRNVSSLLKHSETKADEAVEPTH